MHSPGHFISPAHCIGCPWLLYSFLNLLFCPSLYKIISTCHVFVCLYVYMFRLLLPVNTQQNVTPVCCRCVHHHDYCTCTFLYVHDLFIILFRGSNRIAKISHCEAHAQHDYGSNLSRPTTVVHNHNYCAYILLIFCRCKTFLLANMLSTPTCAATRHLSLMHGTIQTEHTSILMLM